MKNIKNKKIFLILISTLLLLSMVAILMDIPAVHAAGGITRVQGNARGTYSTGSSISVTMTSAPASGNVEVATISTCNSGSARTVSSISQTGVTWSKQVSSSGSDGSGYDDSEIWLGIVGSGASTSVTVNLSGSPSYGGAADICEYSGVATSGSLDLTSTASGSSTSTSTGTTATTTAPNELWIGSIVASGNTGRTQSSPTNSFTLLDGAVVSYMSEAYLEKIVTSTATANSGTTCSGSVNGWFGCIATFKARVTEQVTITPANGYSSSASVSVSGAGASMTSIPMDGAQHTFIANPSSTITFTVPADSSNTRYRFNSAGSASTTWSYTTAASGTDMQSTTVYYQNQQTLSYSVVGGGSPSATTATGRAVGVAYAPSLTTSAANYWFDYSTTSIAFSTPTGTNEQWAPNPSSLSATSSNTQVVSLYNQYKVTFTETGIDSSAGSNTVLTVGSTTYAYNALPNSVYINSGTTFTWASTVSGGAGKQFVETGSSGSSPITATGTYSATYKTQCQVAFSSSGLGGDANGNLVTFSVSGGSYSGATSPVGMSGGSIWVDSGATVTYNFVNPVTSSVTGKQYELNSVTGSTSPITISAANTLTGNYVTQYQLTVNSAYGSTTGSGWYNTGATAYAGLTSGAVSGGTGTQYVFTNWGTGASGTNYAQSNGITMSGPETATANWKTQYYLTVQNGGYGTGSGSGWFDSGASPAFSISPTTVPGVTGVQYAFAAWSGDSTAPSASNSILMNAPKTVTATWTTQFLVTYQVMEMLQR